MLSLEALFSEIAELEAVGIEVVSRLFIAEHCTLILSYHVLLDQAREVARGGC